MHFVYVDKPEYRDKLINLGYQLLKSDDRNNLWVFSFDGEIKFSAKDNLDNLGIQYVLSNQLTF